jgi:hypothetical protein
MPTVKLSASTILGAFEQAQTEIVGKAVILTDGKAGTVENVWLDELHGLRISIRGHDGKWPISTVKFAQTAEIDFRLRCPEQHRITPCLDHRARRRTSLPSRHTVIGDDEG